MSGGPAVSVIVPTYQRRDLVRRATATALAQHHGDFELIVVDDGSTDGTEAALAGLDDRLHYRWQPNRGAAAARNAGLRLARGELIAFLDSDNRWLPDHLSVLTEVLERHPDAVLASTCPQFLVGGRERPSEARVIDPLPEALVGNIVGFITCVVARRDALLAVGGFDERLTVLEDTTMWQRLAMRGGFVFVRRRTVLHGRTRGSLMDHGRRSGAYLEALERSASSAKRDIETLKRPDAPRLVERATGAARWAQAMMALDRGDRAAVADRLADACRLAPELSEAPELAASRLRAHLPRADEPRERLRYFVSTAELWPDRRTDTARYLRLAAAGYAARSGRLRLAAGLLARWPGRGTLGFLRRVRPRLVLIARRRFQDSRVFVRL